MYSKIVYAAVSISSKRTNLAENVISIYAKEHLQHYYCRGGSRVWKEGGHLAEKQLKTKKKKKVTTIIASYPLPIISRLLCKIKSYL